MRNLLGEAVASYEKYESHNAVEQMLFEDGKVREIENIIVRLSGLDQADAVVEAMDLVQSTYEDVRKLPFNERAAKVSSNWQQCLAFWGILGAAAAGRCAGREN